MLDIGYQILDRESGRPPSPLSRSFDTAPPFDTPGHSSGLLRIERSPRQEAPLPKGVSDSDACIVF